MQLRQRPSSSQRRNVKLLELQREIPAKTYWSLGASFISIFLIFWVVLTSFRLIDPLFLPSPKAVFQEFLQQIREGILLRDMGASLYRIFAGWLISTVIAVPLGILMGSFRFFEGLFEPFIDLVRYMPAVAFVPLSILWVGVGDGQKFLILFIGTFFQEVLMVMDNVKNVPTDLINTSYTLGLSKWEILTNVVLPASFPGLWDTFRITLGWCWTYLVVAELVAANVGLGYRIMRAQRFLQTESIILGILVIGFLGLVTDLLFKFGYRHFFRWVEKRS